MHICIAYMKQKKHWCEKDEREVKTVKKKIRKDYRELENNEKVDKWKWLWRRKREEVEEKVKEISKKKSTREEKWKKPQKENYEELKVADTLKKKSLTERK